MVFQYISISVHLIIAETFFWGGVLNVNHSQNMLFWGNPSLESLGLDEQVFALNTYEKGTQWLKMCSYCRNSDIS